MIFNKKCEHLNPQKWCSRLRKTTFSEKWTPRKNIKVYRFLRSRIGYFWALGVILEGQKSSQIMTFRKVKNMKNAWQGHHFWHIGLSKRRTKWERKSMKFRENKWGQKLRFFPDIWEKSGWPSGMRWRCGTLKVAVLAGIFFHASHPCGGRRI